MVALTFIEPDDSVTKVDVAPGGTLMEAAVANSVNSIIAECGGNCACGTCRVYLDEAWRQKIGPPGMFEEPMLEFIADPDADLRLSCQIEVSEQLEGMTVRVSREQR